MYGKLFDASIHRLPCQANARPQAYISSLLSTSLLRLSTFPKSHSGTGLQKIVWAGLGLALLRHVLWESWRKGTGSEKLGDL